MFLHEVNIGLGHNYNCIWLYVSFIVLLRTKRNSTIYGEMKACKGPRTKKMILGYDLTWFIMYFLH